MKRREIKICVKRCETTIMKNNQEKEKKRQETEDGRDRTDSIKQRSDSGCI